MGELLAHNAVHSYQPPREGLWSTARFSATDTSAPEEALAFPYTQVEHRLANAYRSMWVGGDPPTLLARIKELATRTAAD
jgi:hypothetical protein